MAVSAVQHDHVYLGIHKRAHSVQHIGRNAHARAAQQSSLAVLGGKRIFDRLLNIFDGDQACQIIIVVHDGQLLFPRFGKDLLRLLQVDAHFRGDQPFRRHGLFNFLGEICFEF